MVELIRERGARLPDEELSRADLDESFRRMNSRWLTADVGLATIFIQMARTLLLFAAMLAGACDRLLPFGSRRSADGPPQMVDRDGQADGAERARADGVPADVSAATIFKSCDAVLKAEPATASGAYTVSPTGIAANAIQTYCDMTTYGGGWTRVTASVSASDVNLLKGPAGRQMLKCSDTGQDYIVSPAFADPWTWAGTLPVLVGGSWTVSGTSVTCGTTGESFRPCTTYFGVGCDDGSGAQRKFLPGVDEKLRCANSSTAAASIEFAGPCGMSHTLYSVFVRDY